MSLASQEGVADRGQGKVVGPRHGISHSSKPIDQHPSFCPASLPDIACRRPLIYQMSARVCSVHCQRAGLATRMNEGLKAVSLYLSKVGINSKLARSIACSGYIYTSTSLTNGSGDDLSTEPQSNSFREQHVDQPVTFERSSYFQKPEVFIKSHGFPVHPCIQKYPNDFHLILS